MFTIHDFLEINDEMTAAAKARRGIPFLMTCPVRREFSLIALFMKHATMANNAAARNLSNFASAPLLLPRPSHYRSICKLVAVNPFASSMKMAIGYAACWPRGNVTKPPPPESCTESHVTCHFVFLWLRLTPEVLSRTAHAAVAPRL